jgi:DNA-binding GntR family transcriptional regulator
MKSLTTPLRSESLAVQVFKILQEAIFKGTLRPGETLRELELARNLNVSQATVREAMVQLEHSGLVVRLRNRKSEITKFTKEEVRDRLSMRLVLEEMAAIRASQQMTKADFAKLDQLSRDISKAIAGGDQMEVTDADVRFHRFIWEKTGSVILFNTLDQLATPLFAFLGILAKVGMADVRRLRPHNDLVKAIRSGDPENIRKSVQNHIGGSYKEFLASGAPSINALMQTVSRESLPAIRPSRSAV